MYLIIIKINNLQYVILGKISIIVSFLTLDKLRNYIIIDNPKFKPFITYILWFLLFKEDRSESRCTQTSMRLTKHGNFDLILIIVMENNDCKGKKTKHSIKILFKEPKKDKKNAMQQVWKKDFTSNEKCPCTCTEKNGFERLDSTIFEFYIFFIIKSHNFSSKLRGTWNVNIITKVRSYLFWRYSLKNDWLFFF